MQSSKPFYDRNAKSDSCSYKTFLNRLEKFADTKEARDLGIFKTKSRGGVNNYFIPCDKHTTIILSSLLVK